MILEMCIGCLRWSHKEESSKDGMGIVKLKTHQSPGAAEGATKRYLDVLSGWCSSSALKGLLIFTKIISMHRIH